MSTLVFDIETKGEDWDSFDDETKEVVSRWVNRQMVSDAERAVMMRDVREGLGFSPLTGQIVAIGMYDIERSKGICYYQSSTDTVDTDFGEYVLKPRTEAEMLRDFWNGVTSYDTFVTFNGRVFDAPYLILRSVVHGIRPTCDLMEGRYLYQQHTVLHIDLQDQLTFYGAMAKRPSLHLFCRAFNIPSPKTGGVSGDTVSELFNEGRFRDIAMYNVRDVVATTALYQKWLKYLA